MIHIKILTIYLIIINIISFISMGLDKHYAINSRWRISESSLLFLAIILGAVGSYAGMYMFRHKTKHPKFVIGIPIIFFLNIAFIYFLFSKNLITT